MVAKMVVIAELTIETPTNERDAATRLTRMEAPDINCTGYNYMYTSETLNRRLVYSDLITSLQAQHTMHTAQLLVHVHVC